MVTMKRMYPTAYFTPHNSSLFLDSSKPSHINYWLAGWLTDFNKDIPKVFFLPTLGRMLFSSCVGQS